MPRWCAPTGPRGAAIPATGSVVTRSVDPRVIEAAVADDADDIEAVARFFDRRACCAPGAGDAGDGQLRSVSRALLGLLDEVGVAGLTVLDAGSGQGGLALQLCRRGAASVSGIDLSPASVADAQRASDRAGLRATFAVGDASVTELEPHDLVVLDKVVCCYPDVAALLANTVPAARSLLAVAMPRSRGPRGALAHLLVAAENGWRRLVRDPFRAHVHDEVAIARTLERAGLVRTRARHLWTWELAIFERPG
jgi:2-polyprenyl-3-methyl-5-hydroxy-6-metoxy-1,4-benzoquinol methylase